MSNWHGAKIYTMDATFCPTCGAEVGWDGCPRCDGTFDTEDWDEDEETSPTVTNGEEDG